MQLEFFKEQAKQAKSKLAFKNLELDRQQQRASESLSLVNQLQQDAEVLRRTNRNLEESLVDSQTKVLVFEKLQRDGNFDYQNNKDTVETKQTLSLIIEDLQQQLANQTGNAQLQM